MLAPVEIMDGIRMAALPDLAAMKLNAITNRGSKKNFRDYALLLNHFEHGQMLDFFSNKYQAYNRWHVEKSVCYFDDAEVDPDPVELHGMTWQDVKEKILQRCR